MTVTDASSFVDSKIAVVPDFPKPGILFRDVTPLFSDADAFATVTTALSEPFDGGFVAVAGIEARGFALAGAIAIEQGVGVPFTRPTGAAIGRVRDVPDAGSRYIAHLLASTPQPLAGLRVVVDCAYGAAV